MAHLLASCLELLKIHMTSSVGVDTQATRHGSLNVVNEVKLRWLAVEPYADVYRDTMQLASALPADSGSPGPPKNLVPKPTTFCPAASEGSDRKLEPVLFPASACPCVIAFAEAGRDFQQQETQGGFVDVRQLKQSVSELLILQ